nr:oligopeptide/dipeptide ABC transporter ATP-binding protein [Massilistercora timonensis]
MSTHLLEIKDLKKTYPLRGKKAKLFGQKERMCAVNQLSLHIEEGETYGLVGESGCGKSTTGRTIVGLERADSGMILYDGKDLCSLNEKDFRPYRSQLQMVFQNSLSAMNPRSRVGDILEEILAVHGEKDGARRREQVLAIMEKVGLSEEHYFRFPHELSGGQVQRLGIAGALITRPKLIVCDEPVSALDVSIQAQILNMLMNLQKELRLSLLFISHDIGVIRFISDRIGVMYLGELVEETTTEKLFANPVHPYTKTLLCAVPDPYVKGRDFQALEGEQPVRTEEFKGCAFRSRCPYATEKCAVEEPVIREVEPGHRVACHHIGH